MSKSSKFILSLIGFLVVLLIGWVIYSSLSQPNSTEPGEQNQNQNLPDYILSEADEQSLKEFVNYFVSLYNTYGYDYLSNLSALGDEQSLDMQNKTILLIESLSESLPEGYFQETEVLDETLSYRYPNANAIFVTVKARVKEFNLLEQNSVSPRTPNNSSPEQTFEINVNLEVSQQNQKWVVNNIEIKK